VNTYHTVRGARGIWLGLAAACAAVGLACAALVGLWLVPLGGEPSRALQAVAVLAPLALVGLVWRRRARAARWLRALDAFAAREIARAEGGRRVV
jgi:hypothetical protein